MVAKATAAMKPRKACPPSSSPSSGAAMLPPLSKKVMRSRPASVATAPSLTTLALSSTEAPKPTMGMIR